ncbi:MAG: CopL family metal-binding regulatory protein [Pseudomonadota bacterium]|nr:CopL family metal-binding regulatory protein [Pseudomonadota bacterium]
MSFGALLLRLLLCFGLLVNGSAQAIAVTHSAVANQHAGNAAPPCHETRDTKATESHLSGQHLASHAPSKKPDCCKSGACDCACSHGAVATMPAPDTHGRRFAKAKLLTLLPARYVSPALPRLIRPPIG